MILNAPSGLDHTPSRLDHIPFEKQSRNRRKRYIETSFTKGHTWRLEWTVELAWVHQGVGQWPPLSLRPGFGCSLLTFFCPKYLHTQGIAFLKAIIYELLLEHAPKPSVVSFNIVLSQRRDSYNTDSLPLLRFLDPPLMCDLSTFNVSKFTYILLNEVNWKEWFLVPGDLKKND